MNGGVIMNIEQLLQKRDKYQKGKSKLSAGVIQNYSQSFSTTYTHESTAIEGNTISLVETKLLLEDGISIGQKYLREVYEVVNHDKAFQFVKKSVNEKKPLNENMVKDIHQMLMENIMSGGIYRNVEVYISGAQHTPPPPNEMFSQIKNFYIELQSKDTVLNPIELAAWTHAEFVKIHPFVDGNGRTSRLIMNYQLLQQGFLPVSISDKNRLAYFTALEEYAIEKNITPFANMIAELEEKELDFYNKAIDITKSTRDRR